MKKLFLLGILFLSVQLNKAQNIYLNNFINDKDLINASISFNLIKLKTDSIIISYNPNKSLTPASIQKLVTTSAALNILGSNYKIPTYLEYDGYIDTNRILHGNIYIAGNGDPTLASKYFPNNDFLRSWCEAIQKLNIDSITGGIIADASAFSYEQIPSTWSWGDIGNYYGSGVSAISIYDNTVSLSFSSGENNGDSTNIDCIYPYVPEINFYNKVKAGKTKRDEAYVYGAPYISDRSVRGEIPRGVIDFRVKASIHDPAYLTAFELESYLINSGIKINKKATTLRRLSLKDENIISNRIKFHTYYSVELISIIDVINRVSNNQFTEHLLRILGKKLKVETTALSSAQAIKTYLTNKGINTIGYYMTDGCGLSRYNALSASFMTDLLISMKENNDFKNSLPISGKTGTLKYFGKGTILQGKILAKSGSMQRVRSYAGYITSKSGEKYAFAIIINNFNCNSSQIKKKIESLFVGIYKDLD
jgi:D-alanyl-D-alanine carboxypeptidase/D-alanyl-D-alanine-endopeptidase (penicillin-binding protein 4)